MRLLLCAAAVLATVGTAGGSFAQDWFSGLAPKPPKTAPPLDAALPSGEAIREGGRPKATTPGACSFRYPICVHPHDSPDERDEAADAVRVPLWLSALESAYERLVLVLDAGTPRSDHGRGGGAALDLYLIREAPETEIAHAELDALDVGRGVDAGSAYCVASDADDPERAATFCVAEAIAFSLDASETPFSRHTLASHLWQITGRPTAADARAFDDVQAHPERAVVARERTAFSEGSALFPEFLDHKGRDIGAVTLSTYALSAKAESRGGPRFVNEPDTLDVLRATFGPVPSDLARVFGEFALHRAFIGSRDSDGEAPGLRWLGDAGRVRFEWSVPISSLPRRLAPLRPIEAMGSTYVWVAIDTSSPRDLVLSLEWEPPSAFKWMAVVLDEQGRKLRTVDLPFVEREHSLQRTIGNLEGAAAVLLAGINLGGLGPSYPFDPDFEPHEPHGYTVYLAAPD